MLEKTKSDKKKPLAVWALCHPSKLNDFQSFISRNFKTDDVLLTVDDLLKARNHLGSDQAGRFFFEVKYQHSGEVMNIPPGWAHTVINLQVGHVKVNLMNLIYTTFDCMLHS